MMTHEAFFYLACYLAGFLLCFPFGAASLEMLRLSLAGKRRPAYFVAAGSGLASAGWASLSFLGVRSIMHLLEIPWIEFLLLIAATLLVGLFAVLAFGDSRRRPADASRTEEKAISLGPFGQIAKGILLGLVNPQTIASWVLILSLFKKAGLRVPEAGPVWLPFFAAVAAGYETFFLSVIQLARRLQFLRSAVSRARLQRVVAFLLLAMALLFAYAALRIALR
jgi:threonine/homoserine/homoserine lactone efflux protein